MQKIILASTSPARRELMKKLQIPFKVVAPNVDETPLDNEMPQTLVKRLAKEKVNAVATQFPNTLIIGCDQVLTVDDDIFGKPLNHVNAVKQLQKMSGKCVIAYTGLCLLNTKTNNLQLHVERYDVYFRPLTLNTIENYLQADQPYQCAGSVRAEGLGIALFEKMHGDDPNSLIGLPLISLVTMLQIEDVEVLDWLP